MKCLVCLFAIYIFNSDDLAAQSKNSISGKIVDELSMLNLQNVQIEILGTTMKSRSNFDGTFLINSIPKGEFILILTLINYKDKNIPVSLMKEIQILDVGMIRLSPTFKEELNSGMISLTEGELQETENGESNMITGILTSSKDLFLKTVAYEFSPSFFKPRNLGSQYSQILLNGLSVNKIYNSRPQWSNWGGLNDVFRNQEFNSNLSASNMAFGGLAGTINFNTTASKYRKGAKLSFAGSNRTYKGRIMVTYSSGLLNKGWAFTISASRRFALEGYREGTLYSANSFFTSIEKRFNEQHSLNLTGIYASNSRGKSAAMTKEVFNLKNLKYNSYWGYQELQIRNSRIRTIEEPIFQLNHYWKINKKNSIQTNVMYQFGMVGNSRIDYGGTRIMVDSEGKKNIIGGGVNPDPTYYQKLPSYFLKDQDNPDYTNAYLAEKEFLSHGQIKWMDLYLDNMNSEANGGNSIYAIYDDRNDDQQWSVNAVLFSEMNDHYTLNGGLGYKKLNSENFAFLNDLLGGKQFLDVNVYGKNLEDAQNDLQNPNRLVKMNERYKYNFNLKASILESFVQIQYKSKKSDAFAAFNISNTGYGRIGHYENGSYPGNRSLGKSSVLSFTNFGLKAGMTHKFTGRHILNAQAAYLTKAPTVQNSFSNIRENNDVVINLTNEKAYSFGLSYFLRHSRINLKLSSYWIKFEDETRISFYFADGLTGLNNTENTAFVQEVLTGIDKRNIGVELAVEIPLNSSFKLKGVMAVGESIYSNNPHLYLTSDGLSEPLHYGKSYLKNYFTSGGPQQAFSFGFDYSSSNYWWIGSTCNYFSKAFINVAPITRTINFIIDNDGLPRVNYDKSTAQELLEQERFAPYFLVNIVGGKSWKLKKYYLGFFANVSNVMNTVYTTGGYEQSRYISYKNLSEDKQREFPLFGPKYWMGYGTSFYVSLYLRI